MKFSGAQRRDFKVVTLPPNSSCARTKAVRPVMSANTLTITDNRSGKHYDMWIEHETIKRLTCANSKPGHLR